MVFASREDKTGKLYKEVLEAKNMRQKQDYDEMCSDSREAKAGKLYKEVLEFNKDISTKKNVHRMLRNVRNTRKR